MPRKRLHAVPAAGRRARARSYPLTIFLLKEGVPFDDAFDTKEKSVRTVPCTIEGLTCRLVVQEVRGDQPRWTKYLSPVASTLSTLKLNAGNPSAVLLVKRGTSAFALVFGYGRFLLKPGAFHERFGLIATLNSVEPKSIRSIDKKTFSTMTRHVREQTAEEAEASDFGLDVDRDLLRAVVGTPRAEFQPMFGRRISGMDALVINSPLPAVRLGELLDCCLEQFDKKTYRKSYPWVDRIAQVTDRQKLDALDQRLVSAVAAPKHQRLWLAVPEVIAWESVADFTFTHSKKRNIDLNLKDFLAGFGPNEKVDLASLHNRHAVAHDATTGRTQHRWPVYKCINFETELDKRTYLLSGGKWFVIDRDFLDLVNTDVAAIKESNVHLPDYKHTDEGAYNVFACKSARGDLALLDRKTVQVGGGHSQVEICDLLSRKRQLVHVKHYSGSKAMSHLFNQGQVSAELLASDITFREELNARVKNPFRIPDIKAFDPRKYEVVFGIISFSKKNPELPFFSRLTLRATAKRLRAMQYEVTIKNIFNAHPRPDDA